MIGGTGVSVASMRILLEKLAFAIDTLRRESEMTPVLALKEVLGRQSDGIFGQRFLAQSCVEFNLRRGYMRAVSPDTLAAAGFACVAVEKRDDRIYLPACVRFDAGHAAGRRGRGMGRRAGRRDADRQCRDSPRTPPHGGAARRCTYGIYI